MPRSRRSRLSASRKVLPYRATPPGARRLARLTAIAGVRHRWKLPDPAGRGLDRAANLPGWPAPVRSYADTLPAGGASLPGGCGKLGAPARHERSELRAATWGYAGSQGTAVEDPCRRVSASDTPRLRLARCRFCGEHREPRRPMPPRAWRLAGRARLSVALRGASARTGPTPRA
jgi:hypothetical protein